VKNKTNLITFEDGADQEALVMAQLGQGNRHIEATTGLTSGQITYRLHKAKTTDGSKYGYRVQWRRGESPYFKQIFMDYAGILAKEIERKITPKLVHPTPKIVKLKPVKAPTVDEAVAKLKKSKAGWV
jgi:hypothetical protein